MSYTTIGAAVGFALAAALPASSALALNTRSFVSPTGNDSNACTLRAPCRNFQPAYNQTNPGGEIAVLGTAGYGALVIDHAISIVNGGGFEAGIFVAAGGNGITINAGASDAIVLRGLTIDGGSTGNNGILLNGGQLTIDDSVIRHFTSNGIDIEVNNGSAATRIQVSHSLIVDSSGNGVLVRPFGSGGASIVLDQNTINNNGINGVLLDATATAGGITATASNSVVAGNDTGLAAFCGNGQTKFTIFHSVVANNNSGVAAVCDAAGTANLVLGNTVLTGNNTSWQQGLLGFGGTVNSFGDNYIVGNADGDPAPSPIARK